MKRLKIHKLVIWSVISIVTYSACTKDVGSSSGEDPYKEVILPDISFVEDGVSPAQGNIGDTIRLAGAGFLEHQKDLTILFNGEPGIISSATDSTVDVIIPEMAATGAITAKVKQQYFFGPFFRVNGALQMDTIFPGFRGGKGVIRTIIPVDDDKFLIAGRFTDYDNSNIAGGVNRVALINRDGTLNKNFKYGYATGASSAVYTAVRIEEDAKYLVAGGFSKYGDITNMNSIARLNFDGSVDSLPRPVPSGDIVWASALRGGVDKSITQLHLLPDKKFIALGNFRYYVEMNYNLTSTDGFDSTHLDSTLVNYIARFNEDGSLDTTYHFNQEKHYGMETVNGTISGSILLPDQKLLIVGNFTKYDGKTVNRVARLNPDGSLDETFHYGSGADRSVTAITALKDGGYLLLGTFNNYDGHQVAHAVKINDQGKYDPSFDIGKGADGFIYRAFELSNNAILISGTFRLFDDRICNNFVVLNADGSFHKSLNSTGGFNIGMDAVSGAISDVVELKDEKSIIIVGNFGEFDYRATNNIVKLNYE
ncbi:DUF5008 domain-containing protein [Arachidicoccus terrestris]|uniref:DUF5008 domain-containing protein n=1 Tax=Arachidicoccus terrestris TaxID=2875539 RepID=UPI001CC47931|nr:DUF5008 domain-containing protein [Arachidicoccus terrestris]UAY54216.1 DUF5008 domain-containing protein [Arachidicoccus terrestris]